MSRYRAEDHEEDPPGTRPPAGPVSLPVSVILPIRNEAGYIGRCLESLAAQDYPADRMEILVVDGRSTDDTREVVRSFQERLAGLRLLDNPGRIVPTAMNIGIQEARGKIIVRVDGHCILAPDYVRRCVETLEETGADCVGGPMRCEGESFGGSAIAIAMSSRFGVGNVLFRREDYRGEADTVYLGAWPREVFARVGLFDEELSNNQDDELAYRLRKAGGRIFVEPEIRSRYFARSTRLRLWRQYYRYGLFKVRVLQKHPLLMKARHFVPPGFVGVLLLGAGLAPFVPWARWAFLTQLGLYAAANLAAAVALARSTGWAYLPAFPILFAILHFSYGSGFLVGLFRFAGRWLTADREVPHLSLPEESAPVGEWPRVSVLIPMRNEADAIRAFLDSLEAQDYPAEKMEWLVVDGESTDGSREAVEARAERLPAGRLRLLHNPRRSTPHALNLGLQAATGEVIVRMDAHSVYADDYVRQCVSQLIRTGATQVGGPQVAEHAGALPGAIAAAVNSPFGVGGATFRYRRRLSEVDSVYLGCALKETLVRVGGWNAEAIYDEDTDLNARLRRRGGRLLLVPEIRVRYRPRTDWLQLALQYARYGFGRARTFQRYPETMRLSHLVPPLFTLALVTLGSLAVLRVPAADLAAGVLLVMYALVNAVASWSSAGGRPGRAMLVFLTFPWMHVSWTLGLAVGMLRFGLPARAVLQALRRLRRGSTPAGAAAGGEAPR